MHVDSMFSGDFLKASNLNGKDAPVTIRDITQEEIGGDQKFVVSFHGTDKKLVLNKTNANIIAEQHGKDTDNWVGKKITLYPTRTEFQGKVVDCIRVRFQADTPPPQAAAVVEVALDNEPPF